MREILFRGQTRRFGEKVKNFAGDPMPSNWVYGGICCGEGAFSIIYAYMDGEKEIPIEKHVVYTDTLGQYTGLTDKNGNKIFEGDIVKDFIPFNFTLNGQKLYKENTYIVEYSNKKCGFSPFCEEGYDGVPIIGECVVIGNIHDNPELLKGGAE